jgi:hypothetical protein
MADLRVDIAAEFVGKKAFTEAGKATSGLEKAVGKLGKQLLGVFAVSKFVAFGKASVKAFAADELAAVRLTSALKNLGLELAAPAVTQYIDNLSRATAVADDQLRPAFQALINTTGSLTASQRLLSQAIDVSAGSGVALETVAQDLANAYVGQTRGLRKYNLGLTQAQLKTATFEELMGRLNKQFSGANAAFLDTYAGKLQALGVAGGEAQEKIGGAIIDLSMALSGASDIDELITKIESLSDKVVGMFDRFQEGVSIIGGVLNAKTFGGMRDAIQKAQVEEYNRRMRRDYMKAWEGVDMPKSAAQLAAEKAAEAAARKRAQAILKAQEKNTAELKKQNSLKKSGTAFDREQVERIAALKGKLSEEERTRIQAQLALLNNNDVLAQKLTKEILMAQDATGGLYRYFLSIGDAKIKNPFAFLDEWIMEFQSKLNNLKFPTMPTATAAVVAASVSGVPAGQPWSPGFSMGGNNTPGASFPDTNVGTIPTGNFTYGQGNPLNTNVYVTVQGSVTTEEDLVTKIASGLQQKSLSTGDSSYINRRTGGFAG